MIGLLSAFGTFRNLLQVVLLWAAVLLALVAVTDWLLRTRRLGPFSPVARFFRKHVDPLLAPIERRVVRAGGQPASAPWWALGALLIAGVVLLALVDFVRDLLMDVANGVSGGPGGIARLLVYWFFMVLRVAIIVRVVSSWLPVSPFSPWVRWAFAATEPILRPLRRIIPPFGNIDITPIIAFFGLGIIEALARGFLG